MNTRSAFLALGVMIAGLTGETTIETDDDSVKRCSADMSWLREPQNIVISESAFKNLIIEREDNDDITIPFSEIIDEMIKYS
ncbi:unnamed protein product, partial [marine sediment metagenome]